MHFLQMCQTYLQLRPEIFELIRVYQEIEWHREGESDRVCFTRSASLSLLWQRKEVTKVIKA